MFAADERVQASIAAITDQNRLERITERLLAVSSWQELLQTS
jgi:hypothetical protein